ncbi:MAG: hypothetical protein KDD76_04570, partial [Rickettsiales bacterium]|nr:hypothetical protein [Rickettsiales bacterium]
QAVLDEALRQAESGQPEHFLCVHSEGWHPGVIGIVAGRLKERFDLPTAVLAVGNGIGKASARSVRGVDIGAAITAARQEGLLLAGGGHAMAGGFTLEMAKLDAFLAFMQTRLQEPLAAYHTNRALWLDGTLPPAAVTPALAEALGHLAPFGNGNPRPVFAIPRARLVHTDILKNSHLRCIFTESGPAAMAATRVKAMAFRAMDTELGNALLGSVGKEMAVALEITPGFWQGNVQVDCTIRDIALY